MLLEHQLRRKAQQAKAVASGATAANVGTIGNFASLPAGAAAALVAQGPLAHPPRSVPNVLPGATAGSSALSGRKSRWDAGDAPSTTVYVQ